MIKQRYNGGNLNKYFGTASAKSSKKAYQTNLTLGSIRAAILQNRAMCLGTSEPEKWHTILRAEFPNVSLRIDKDAVYINEKVK